MPGQGGQNNGEYFLHKVRAENTEPIYEETIMKMIGVERLEEAK